MLTRIFPILLFALSTACTNGSAGEEDCNPGQVDGSFDLSLTGGVSKTGSFLIVCGLNPEEPWGVTTQIIPDGLGAPPYIEFRLQNAEDWAFSTRFGGVVEPGTLAAMVPTTEEPAPPTGHGWYAEPVTTEGYKWTLSEGELNITDVQPSAALPDSISLLTGDGSAEFGGESDLSLTFSFVDFPVVAQ